jgi:dipeptidyl aminopeptidase/acylaminoacyl peptidase
MGAIVSTLAFPVPDKQLSAANLVERSQRLVKLQTASGLSLPAYSIQTSAAKFTVIYSHGNAEDVGLSVFYLDRMAQTCDCNVFAYEYPGYSIAEGKPSEENCYQAIQAAFDYVTNTLKVDPSKVVLMGRSLGSGPTVDMAAHKLAANIGGVILQSPLESGIRAVMGFYSSYGLYLFDIFRSYEKVHAIPCPVFILHGTEDRVVPCDNGRALYSTLQQRSCHVPYEPKWIPGRGHNDMPERECLDACRKFLLFLKNRRR